MTDVKKVCAVCYFNVIDRFISEMENSFSERNSPQAAALQAIDPINFNFLSDYAVKFLLSLVNLSVKKNLSF